MGKKTENFIFDYQRDANSKNFKPFPLQCTSGLSKPKSYRKSHAREETLNFLFKALSSYPLTSRIWDILFIGNMPCSVEVVIPRRNKIG